MFRYFLVISLVINIALIAFFIKSNHDKKTKKKIAKILIQNITKDTNSVTNTLEVTNDFKKAFEKNDETFLSNLYKKHKLLNCRTKNFWKDSLIINLSKNHPKLKVYVLIEFKKNITPPVLDFIYESYRFKIFKDEYPYYLKKKKKIFKGAFVNLKYLIKYKEIKSIFLLKEYPVKGFYSIRLSSRYKPEKAIEFKISMPKNTSGISLYDFRYRLLSGRNKIISSGKTNGYFFINTRLKKKSFLTYYSSFSGNVNIEKYLNKTIYSAGKNITLKEYQNWIKIETNKYITMYTNFSDKIDYSDLVGEVKAMVKKEKSLASSVKYIIKKLDDEIKYDFRKRKLFFSGNLTYTNIRDMYLKCSELTTKKIGACPEQSSLEIATLRSLGILSRSATRLYHIYAEVYLPKHGWVTTSPELDEIRLIESQDEKQSYFIDWQPEHPIDIKWKGEMYPELVDFL